MVDLHKDIASTQALLYQGCLIIEFEIPNLQFILSDY